MAVTTLTQEAFEKSRRLIETTARPLEIAMFRHAFDGASGESVVEALKKYQNTDGGFGHALEPDLRTNESSALCTSIAFRVLRSIQAERDRTLVSAGIAYLLETLDRKQAHWQIIPRSAEQSSHAPWWNQAGREDAFDDFSLNPTAEILGYLYDYHGEVHRDILSRITDQLIRHLSDLEEIEMHELICCLRLSQTKTLPEDIGQLIRKKLIQLISATVSNDPAQWKEYSLRPVQVVDDPGSPFLLGREEAVAANLDYEISSQNEDNR